MNTARKLNANDLDALRTIVEAREALGLPVNGDELPVWACCGPDPDGIRDPEDCELLSWDGGRYLVRCYARGPAWSGPQTWIELRERGRLPL